MKKQKTKKKTRKIEFSKNTFFFLSFLSLPVFSLLLLLSSPSSPCCHLPSTLISPPMRTIVTVVVLAAACLSAPAHAVTPGALARTVADRVHGWSLAARGVVEGVLGAHAEQARASSKVRGHTE
jgi:hypothetical protein